MINKVIPTRFPITLSNKRAFGRDTRTDVKGS
jgi:hypothetical protein